MIMASGMGRRFGGNKLLEDFCGEPMIMRILSATEGLFSRRVVVTRHQEIADLCKKSRIESILHDLPHRSDTVRLGLEAIGEAEGCLFCPADQPLLARETIAALLRAFADDSNSIWRPACEGIPGSPVLFPAWAFGELLTLPEGKGGGFVANKYPEQVRLLPVRDAYELMDADTPEALSVLLER